MKLTHTGDNGLAGLLIVVDPKGWVLFGKLLDCKRQLLLVALGLWLNRYRNNWLREGHGLQNNLVVWIAEGVTGGGVLQADGCVDVASGYRVDRVFLAGVHLEELSDALFSSLCGVDNSRAAVDLARVDTDVGEAAKEWVGDNLERKRGEGLVGVRVTN